MDMEKGHWHKKEIQLPLKAHSIIIHYEQTPNRILISYQDGN